VTRGIRIAPALVAGALAAGLALPSTASAHAYLVKTVPAASVVLNAPPPNIQLTYDEAVEPRFAIISVTNVNGHQETTRPVYRSPSNPDTLVVPLRPNLPEGWYLIYWRAISVDGHPVNGFFTYAVGPNPGPAPQFRIPNISATATTPQLLITRWAMFIFVMAAIGLLVMRLLVVRPVVRSVEGVKLKAVSVAFGVAAVLGLVAIPVYLDVSTANDSLRSVFDLTALVPLYRVTAFGRAMLDLELCFALFCVAAGVALWLDRPDRPRRSVAELIASCGALLAAAAVLIVPGAAGHAAQTSPRGLTLVFDWLHLASGSVWLGGLIGLLVLWSSLYSRVRVPALSVTVPRFSNVALVSVLVLAATGIGEAIEHMPAVNALWETGYGKAILVKAGLLGGAMLIASGNLLRSRPRLIAAQRRSELGEPAARLLRGLISGEVVVVIGIVFAAAVLSSLAPPPPSVRARELGAREGGPRPGSSDDQPRGVHVAGPGLSEQGRGTGLVRAADHQGRTTGARSQCDAAVQPPRDADANPGVPADRDRARGLLARGAGAGDGRPLGAHVPGGPEARSAVHGADRRPGQRVTAPSYRERKIS
jgi:copper transport protein